RRRRAVASPSFQQLLQPSPQAGGAIQSVTVETTRGFYAYGIVPSSRTDLPDTGMGFDEPHLAAVGPVAVVGEWVDLQANLAKKRHLTAHTDLLNRLAQDGPVLPLQFGSVLADDGQAVADL